METFEELAAAPKRKAKTWKADDGLQLPLDFEALKRVRDGSIHLKSSDFH